MSNPIANSHDCPAELWDLFNEEQRVAYDEFCREAICPVCKAPVKTGAESFMKTGNVFVCPDCGTNIEPYKTCLGVSSA